MDKQRPPPNKARIKSRGLPPPGDFIALGSKNRSAPDTDARVSTSSGGIQQRKIPSSASAGPSSVGIIYPREKRKDASVSALPVHPPHAKQAKLTAPVLFGRGRDLSEARSKSPVVGITPDALDKKPVEEMDEVTTQFDALLSSVIKSLKISKLRPEPSTYLSLLSFAKENPDVVSSSSVVMEKLLGCLKRENTGPTMKPKPNPMLCNIAANILLVAYIEKEHWPDSFIKVYVEDALAERIWVDNDLNKTFVDNIVTAFDTAVPPRAQLPIAVGDDRLRQLLSVEGQISEKDVQEKHSSEELSYLNDASVALGQSLLDRVKPRYKLPKLELSIQYYILDVVKDQLSKRQMIDSVSRNLLRFLVAVCGYAEVRVLATQRIETWLQNPKLTRPAQELLMSVAMNCNTHSAEDMDVISYLVKMRLKTKPLANLYISSIREMLNQHPENLGTTLRHVIYNELSQQRNPNNMTILGVIFQIEPETASKYLASVFQGLMTNREDYLRALRALFREISRALRYEIKYVAFCRGLMQEPNDPSFNDLDTTLKDRMLFNLVDLVCMATYVSASPAVRDVAIGLSKGEVKDQTALEIFQNQTSEIQRDAVWWFHTKLVTTFECSEKDFFQLLSKVLFLEAPDSYQGKDNWPPEADKQLLFNLVQDVPLLEDMLLRFVILGLTDEFPLNSADTLDVLDRLVQRSALLKTGQCGLHVSKPDVIDMVLTLALYSHPKDIILPVGYSPPSLAISDLYWKALSIILIIACCNPDTVGIAVWESQPTLRCMMEMIITGNYNFPPLPKHNKTSEDAKITELQIRRAEKEEIILFETHLAAATISESNSLLANQLISLESGGNARQPPQRVIDRLKKLNKALGLGYMLCRCRDPDFLLMIIESQDSSQSMPWLADLVHASEGSLNVLPVQCLCEFLLMEDIPPPADGLRHIAKKKKDIRKDVVKRLRGVLVGCEATEHGTAEMISYFLSRLGSPKLIERKAAVSSLSLLLDGLLDVDTDIEMIPAEGANNDAQRNNTNRPSLQPSSSPALHSLSVVDNQAAVTLFRSYTWLFDTLPRLGYFDSVMPLILAAIQQSFYYEVDVERLQSYVIFTSQHLPNLTELEMRRFSEDLSLLVTTRTSIFECMVADGETPQSSATLNACFSIFVACLNKEMLSPEASLDQIDDGDDLVCVTWHDNSIHGNKKAYWHVTVLHAAVVVLAACQSQELLESKECASLLELLFPGTGQMQAVSVSTGEQADLFPDWLRGVMLSSSIERLTDAALCGLSPGQMVIFMQMFGLPVTTVSKLLRTLDRECEDGREGLTAIINKRLADSLFDLVEVQWSRGATGGLVWAEFLREGYTRRPAANIDDLEDILQPVTVEISMSDATEMKPDKSPLLTDERISSILKKVFIEQSHRDSSANKDVSQLFSKDLLCSSPDILKRIVDTLNVILVTGSRSRCLDGFLVHSGLVSAMLQAVKICRLRHKEGPDINIKDIVNGLSALYIEDRKLKLLLRTMSPKDNEQPANDALPASAGSYSSLDRALLRLSSAESKRDGHRHMVWLMKCFARAAADGKLFDPGKLSISKCVKACEWALNHDNLMFGRLVNVICTLFTRHSPSSIPRRRDAVKRCVEFLYLLDQLHRPVLPHLTGGIIVDWLETIDPEIVVVNPIMQRQMLFMEECTKTTAASTPDNKRSPYAYLRSLVAHQSSSDAVQDTLLWFLSLDMKSSRVNATSVLDFVTTIVDNPRLWQGRDIKQNAFDNDRGLRMSDEVVLKLNASQLGALTQFVAKEMQATVQVTGEGDGTLDEGLRKTAEKRIVLLINHAPTDAVRCLPNILRRLKDDGIYSDDVVGCLQRQLYLVLPHVVGLDDTTPESIVQGRRCELDRVIYDAISNIANADDTYERANILLCKLASQHPLLLLRHVSIFARLLHGRHRLSPREFRLTNQLLPYTSLMSILDALRPHIFNGTEFIRVGLSESISTIFTLLKSRCLLTKQSESLLVKLVEFLTHAIDTCGPWMRSFLLPYSSFLNDYLLDCPEMPHLRQVCIVISLNSEVTSKDSTNEASSALNAIHISSERHSIWGDAELAEINEKLSGATGDEDVSNALSDADDMSKRQPDVLLKFFPALLRLMTSNNSVIREKSFQLALRHCQVMPQNTCQLVLPCVTNLSRGDIAAVELTAKMVPKMMPLVDDTANRRLLLKLFRAATTSDCDVTNALVQCVKGKVSDA